MDDPLYVGPDDLPEEGEMIRGDFREHVVHGMLSSTATLQWYCEGDDEHEAHEDTRTFLEVRFITHSGVEHYVLIPPQAVIGLIEAGMPVLAGYFPGMRGGPVDVPDSPDHINWGTEGGPL